MGVKRACMLVEVLVPTPFLSYFPKFTDEIMDLLISKCRADFCEQILGNKSVSAEK